MSLFLSDLRRQCREHGVKLSLVRAKLVDVGGGIRCGGWFDPVTKEIVVARRHNLWLANLVHESCHMDQWIEQSGIWKKEEKFGTSTVDRWLLGKSVYSIRKSVNNLISLELDCERRSVAKMIKYDLPINIVTYIQKANEVLLYYKYIYETHGEWSDKDFSGFNHMPKRLMSDQYYKRKLSEKKKKIFVNQGL